MNTEHRCLFCDHVFIGRRRKFCFDCLPAHGDIHTKVYNRKYIDLYIACGLHRTSPVLSSRLPDEHPAQPPKSARPPKSVQLTTKCGGCDTEVVSPKKWCSETCRRRNIRLNIRRGLASSTATAAPEVPQATILEVVLVPHKPRRDLQREILRMWPVGECARCCGPLQPWWEAIENGPRSRTTCYACQLDAITGRQQRKAKTLVACVICSAPFERTGQRRNTCSDACKREAIREKDRRQNMRRRSARTGEPYTLRSLYDRSCGICHLCDGPVDYSLPANHPMGPTVDHLLPLSHGGIDCDSNVALAHWSCNIKRGNRLLEAK